MIYNVNVHYEGGWLFEVEADSEDEAKDIAEKMFEEIDDKELVANLADVKVDDCWEAH